MSEVISRRIGNILIWLGVGVIAGITGVVTIQFSNLTSLLPKLGTGFLIFWALPLLIALCFTALRWLLTGRRLLQGKPYQLRFWDYFAGIGISILLYTILSPPLPGVSLLWAVKHTLDFLFWGILVLHAVVFGVLFYHRDDICSIPVKLPTDEAPLPPPPYSPP